MDTYDVRRLALILAVQAEIDGMKAQNLNNSIHGHTPTYQECDFETKANKLRDLAFIHNEQII